MRRKAVVRSLESIARLRAVLRACSASLARRVACRLGRRQEAPRDGDLDCRPLLESFRAELALVERGLTVAEDEYARARARGMDLRPEHEDAKWSLHRKQSQIRRLISQLPDGRRLLEQAAIASTTPQAAPALVRQTERTIRLLSDLDPATLKPSACLRIDPGILGEELQTPLRRLEAAGATLEDARAAADVRRCRADDELARAKLVVPGIARCLESLCRLAREHRLAERIRACMRPA